MDRQPTNHPSFQDSTQLEDYAKVIKSWSARMNVPDMDPEVSKQIYDSWAPRYDQVSKHGTKAQSIVYKNPSLPAPPTRPPTQPTPTPIQSTATQITQVQLTLTQSTLHDSVLEIYLK